MYTGIKFNHTLRAKRGVIYRGENKNMAFLTEHDKTYKTPEDICAHLGDDYARFEGAIVPPIYQNTLFVQPTEANGIEHTDYAYSRTSNPTVEIAERKIAALEGAEGALVFSTGVAAINTAVLHFVRAGSHVILVDSSYGCTMAFVRGYLHDRFGITYTNVDGSDPEEIRRAIRPETSLICLESPSSLIFRMQDLAAVAEIAREHGIGTVIDNTYATPLYQHPLSHGIDIVCHTATKYLGGHSDIMGGALCARREIIESIQNNERSLIGACMDPHQAWLLIRGMRTMPVRLKQHAENAAKVAAFLETHPKVERVIYPGSETYPQKGLFDRYMTGQNGLMSICLRGDADDARRFVSRLHYFQNGCSWGGFESLAIFIGDVRPASAPESGAKNLVRLHIGLEDAGTLIADLQNALG